MIDFGLSNFFLDVEGNHIAMSTDSPFIGTAAFASPNSHKGLELSRRDDLISLGYLIYYVYNGSLPWVGLSDPKSARCTEVAKNKAQFPTTVDS